MAGMGCMLADYSFNFLLTSSLEIPPFHIFISHNDFTLLHLLPKVASKHVDRYVSKARTILVWSGSSETQDRQSGSVEST